VAKLLMSRKAEVDAVNDVKSCFDLCTIASLLLWSCLTRFLSWLGITDILTPLTTILLCLTLLRTVGQHSILQHTQVTTQ
jgi:hypothetical protein